uniref:Uncharacterized protein n=1 Tax=Chromera velia CCMP2878 TaxID=1169474 RepID=A0A0G4G039_9ALVE|eukprot:Cvel_520.t1-p1 / transcript=Cvel_520.t1 / gene=Cvel_520 / organism=Chromera_velia_CCMP2878 / gene_product=hypothetical protein / transcript_product=hypothetical protein / location=Cvel_scaffold16:91466-93454(+) / protein_length=466 / sequence_SO=supercontig / SO=protein_coding / is_pseudo=false
MLHAASVGPSEAEAKALFAVLPASLETLVLKGNPVGSEGIRGLTEWIGKGKASSLLHLDLESTGLKNADLKTLCAAVEGKSLKVETLKLLGNKFEGEAVIEKLCSVLRADSLPGIRMLMLQRYNLLDGMVDRLVDCMGAESLPKLEILSLDKNSGCRGTFLSRLGGALRKDVVPELQFLSLQGVYEGGPDIPVFLGALSADECPPHLYVHLEGGSWRSNALSEQDVHLLGAGKCSRLRTLSLELRDAKIRVFFQAVVGDPESPLSHFDHLDLSLVFDSDEDDQNEAFRLAGEALQMGRMCPVRKLALHDNVLEDTDEEETDGAGTVRGGKTVFFTALGLVKLFYLSELHLTCDLTDERVTLFSHALREGNLTGLRCLRLSGLLVSGTVVEALVRAVVESEAGLPLFEKIDLTSTFAGGEEGVTSIETALTCGKMPKLSQIDLTDSSLTMDGLRGLGDAVRRERSVL